MPCTLADEEEGRARLWEVLHAPGGADLVWVVGRCCWLAALGPPTHETEKFGVFFPHNQISPLGARSGAFCRVAQITGVRLLLSRGSGQCAGACTDPHPVCPMGTGHQHHGDTGGSGVPCHALKREKATLLITCTSLLVQVLQTKSTPTDKRTIETSLSFFFFFCPF